MAYRLYGSDMDDSTTPLEAGLERFVALDKGDFVGRDALVAQQAGGVARRLCCLTVEALDADPHAYEPVYADVELVSYVMAGGYGHRVGTAIALAYLPAALARPGTRLEVEILGDRRPARMAEQPLYDPGNIRLLS
jgi:dimethylglycine dehydrogenase